MEDYVTDLFLVTSVDFAWDDTLTVDNSDPDIWYLCPRKLMRQTLVESWLIDRCESDSRWVSESDGIHDTCMFTNIHAWLYYYNNLLSNTTTLFHNLWYHNTVMHVDINVDFVYNTQQAGRSIHNSRLIILLIISSRLTC